MRPNYSFITLVIFSTVTVFDLVKTSQARVVAGLSLGIAATVGLSCDRHSTGDSGHHHRWEVRLRVRIAELEKEQKRGRWWQGRIPVSVLTHRYFLQKRTADPSLPLRDHSSSPHSQRPKPAPAHQHPALYHPRHIATHGCFYFFLTWQTLPQRTKNLPVKKHLSPAASRGISPAAGIQKDSMIIQSKSRSLSSLVHPCSWGFVGKCQPNWFITLVWHNRFVLLHASNKSSVVMYELLHQMQFSPIKFN